MNEYPCPLCGADTNREADCPGYEDDEVIMVCSPTCGYALRVSCTRCAWWYRAPNLRHAPDMGILPDWMGKAFVEYDEAAARKEKKPE